MDIRYIHSQVVDQLLFNMITQERLKELFDYRDGELIRKKTGKSASVKRSLHHRYLRMTIDGKVAHVHRMIFLWHHGFLPDVTDHIDGNKYNNCIENLRACTQSENCLNSKHRATSTSPYKNVYLQKYTNHQPHWKQNWVVNITINRKRQYIGSFEDVELADLVATEARDLYHGQYARHS
jgi:hypothetical protein